MQRFWGILSILLALLSVFSCWNMAVRFLLAWMGPFTADNIPWIQYGVGILIMEFVVLHSGGLLAGASASTLNRKKKIGLLTLLIAVYSLMAALIAGVFHSMPLFYSFSTVMFCRLATGFFAVSEKNVAPLLQRSITSALLYFAVIVISVVVPFPQGNVASASLAGSSGDGVWNHEPQRALAAGLIYFFSMGLFEIYSLRVNVQKSAAERSAKERFYRKFRAPKNTSRQF